MVGGNLEDYKSLFPYLKDLFYISSEGWFKPEFSNNEES
jgi:hypothetical protein